MVALLYVVTTYSLSRKMHSDEKMCLRLEASEDQAAGTEETLSFFNKSNAESRLISELHTERNKDSNEIKD